VVQVAVNRHDPDRPTVGIWFAARLVEARAEPRSGDDAVAVGWFDPTIPPPLAFPTDAAVLAGLAAQRRGLLENIWRRAGSCVRLRSASKSSKIEAEEPCDRDVRLTPVRRFKARAPQSPKSTCLLFEADIV